MPIGIDHGASQRIVSGHQPFVLPVAVDDGGAMRPSHMIDILVGISAVGRMAVDALVRNLRVLYQGRLVEGRQVALVEAHLAVNFIAGRDATIGNSPLINLFLTYYYLKTTIACPLPILLSTYRQRQFSTLVGL